jgi:hypothetical protein
MSMNAVLWILQVLVALYTLAGVAWRASHYDAMAQQVPSLGSLPFGAWMALGTVEALCALTLLLAGLLLKRWPGLTPIAAGLLTLELLLVTAVHARHFGFALQATNPALWTLGLALLAAFIAYGRTSLAPFPTPPL